MKLQQKVLTQHGIRLSNDQAHRALIPKTIKQIEYAEGSISPRVDPPDDTRIIIPPKGF
jgi:hypothetical protein